MSVTSLKNLGSRALLIVLDGYGINPNETKNAVKDAHTPNLDKLLSQYPHTQIEAGGTKVGLPKGLPGNSEVGHMNLGSGKPVRQDLVRINEAVENHTLGEMEKFRELVTKAKENSGRIHLMGLLSDGGVHSHISHIKEVIRLLGEEEGIEVFFHAFMDGRDTAPDCGEIYLKDLLALPNFTFASMQGRSIGMDRDRRWEKIEKCYKTFIGEGPVTDKSPIEYLKSEYAQKRNDEFLEPVLFDKKAAMGDGDCVFFMNFRPDRAIQITMALNDPNFYHFERPWTPAHFLCMTPYVPDDLDLPILFDKEPILGGFSDYLSKLGKKQFKIAETEKYAHVTYFFNGGRKAPYDNEEQVLIPSPKEVKTYDEKPEMSAFKVVERLLKALDEDHDFYLVNFANCDMVGHTGNYEASVKAVEAVDQCVGKLMKKCETLGIPFALTADHGNCDQMVYEDGSPHTSHTGSPVPFVVFHPSLKGQKLEINGEGHALMDVSPTMLTIMGIEYPETFEGKSIFQ